MSLSIVEERTEQAAYIHAKYMSGSPAAADGAAAQSGVVRKLVPTAAPQQSLTDVELVGKILTAQNAAAVLALWNGDTSAYGNDHSRADSALCAHLAFWTNDDPERIERLFRMSGLYREKWEREDYRTRTINGAIEARRRHEAERAFLPEWPANLINPVGSPEALKRYTLDDMGTARLFADTYRKIVLYVIEYRCYCIWVDGVWIQDKGDVIVRQLAKQLADSARDAVPPPNPEENEDPWKKYRTYYGKYRFLTHRKTLIQDAQDELSAHASQFDQRPYLFNMRNCTFNLETMRPQPHNPADLLSKMANVVYAAGARCVRFDQFIDEITENNYDRKNMLQKATGYCLKGEANEECYFTVMGLKTRNGKGTFFDTLLNIHGTYGAQMDFNTIARGGTRDGSRATPDLARLIGIRLVLSNEPEKGVCVNEALLKQMTGNDDITARPLYGDVIQFKPVFRLFVTANSKPAVSDDSLFASGRIKLLPFTRFFDEDERDTGLKALFRTEEAKSGIFNWLLDGYVKYRAEGLRDTAEMKKLTAEYRRENDYVTQYLDDRFDFDAKGTTTLKRLRVDYATWCDVVGTKPLGLKVFKEELEKRGLEIKIIHNNVQGVSGMLRNCYDYTS